VSTFKPYIKIPPAGWSSKNEPATGVAVAEEFEGFEAIALRNAALGYRVFPVNNLKKKSAIKKFPELATSTDIALIKEWARKFPDASCGLLATHEGHFFIDEDDSKTLREGYEKATGKPFPRTHTTESRPNHRQSHWLQTDYTRKRFVEAFPLHGNIVQDRAKDGMFSLRFWHYLILGEGSLHPSGVLYHVVDDAPTISMPDDVVDYILSCTIEKPVAEMANGSGVVAGEAKIDEDGMEVPARFNIIVGKKGRNVALSNYIWWVYQNRPREVLEKWAHAYNLKHCNPPLGAEEVNDTIKGKLDKKITGKNAILIGGVPASQVAMSSAAKKSPAKAVQPLKYDADKILSGVAQNEVYDGELPELWYLDGLPEEVQSAALSQIAGRVGARIIVTDNSERTEPVEMEMVSEMPQSALASTRLGDIYADLFQPNDFPLDLALPALVTAASVLVPPFVDPPDSTIIRGDENVVSLYTALIAKAGGGKSQVTEWAAKSLNIFNVPLSQHYFEEKWGSAEQMFKRLAKLQNRFSNGVLLNPDELAHLFAKAGIPNASFATHLTTAFYRRRHNLTIAKGVELSFNFAMSLIGGIVDDEFGTVLNSATIGGLYDRMLFAEAAPGFHWVYRDYPCPVSNMPLDPAPVAVSAHGSVSEVEKAWRKEDSGLGRIVEVCIRVAKIYASMDGRSVITGTDLEALKGFAMRQKTIRTLRQPNAGVTPDAIFANGVIAWLRSHTKGEWVLISVLKDGVHCYEMKLGPNVAERCLQSMARGDQIDLWFPKVGQDGNRAPLPEGYNGAYPRLGLVRLPKR